MGQHGGSIHPWRYSSWVGAVLIGVVGYINILSPNAPHPHRPEFREYEYMRLRGKPLPWGDGNHTLFHIDEFTPLPDGYVKEEGHLPNPRYDAVNLQQEKMELEKGR